MIEWYQIVSYFFTTWIRIFLCLCLLIELLQFHKVKYHMAALTLGGAVLATILSLLQLSYLYIIGIEMIALISVVRYNYHGDIRMSFFLTFFYEVCVALWEFLVSAGLGVLFQSERFIDNHTHEYVLSVWVVRLVMFGIAVFISKIQNEKSKKTFRLASIIAIMGLFGTIALSQQSIILLNNDQLTAWLIMAILVMIAVLLFNLNSQHAMEREIFRLRQEHTELLEHDYQILSNTYAANAKLFHDFHNHIEVLYRYLTQGSSMEAIKYLEELRTPIKLITETVWTGDEAIDYLISSKLSIAEQEQIKTTVNIEFPRKTDIRSTDLCTILGNLLDNALEASCIAKDNLRFLSLTIRRINDMLVIKIENGCEKDQYQKSGELQTSKENNGLHGWGLSSARTATEKYDGTLETTYKNGVFQAVVILSYNAVKMN